MGGMHLCEEHGSVWQRPDIALLLDRQSKCSYRKFFPVCRCIPPPSSTSCWRSPFSPMLRSSSNDLVQGEDNRSGLEKCSSMPRGQKWQRMLQHYWVAVGCVYVLCRCRCRSRCRSNCCFARFDEGCISASGIVALPPV